MAAREKLVANNEIYNLSNFHQCNLIKKKSRYVAHSKMEDGDNLKENLSKTFIRSQTFMIVA